MMGLFTDVVFVAACDRDDDVKVDSISSLTAAADVIAIPNVASGCDIHDTPVTFQTRLTRAKLVSTMLRQQSISQNVAASQVLTRTAPAVPHHVAMTDAQESSTIEKTDASSVPQSCLPTVQSTCQSSTSVSTSEEIATPVLSADTGKLTNVRRSRSSVTKVDATELPVSLPLSEPTLKAESDECRPAKVETSSTSQLSTAASPVRTSIEATTLQTSSTTLLSTTAVVDSSMAFGERNDRETATSQMSPIARNNQTLYHHLRHPPSFPGLQTTAIDVKKLRLSPAAEIKSLTTDEVVRRSPQAADSKAGQALDQMPTSSSSLSSSLSVTYNPPSRQPLSVKIDTVNTGSSQSSRSNRPVPASKSNIVAPRFVS